MSRIRTIKPQFFRNEELNDLEDQFGNLKPMLVFAGLWTVCDKNGVFLYKPRSLKLDILPFLNFDIVQTLEILEKKGFINTFTVDNVKYGHVIRFSDHQRINGSEAQEESKYPNPEMADVQQQTSEENQGNILEASGKHQGSTEETPWTAGREGKGKEVEGIYTDQSLKNKIELPEKKENVPAAKKSEKPKKAALDKPQNCLFEDSPVANFMEFRKAFNDSDYEQKNVDFQFYYERVKNWSASKNAKKVNWIATARNFMLSDAQDGKLKILKVKNLSTEFTDI